MSKITLNSYQEFQNFQNTANQAKQWFDYKMISCNLFEVTANTAFLESLGF